MLMQRRTHSDNCGARWKFRIGVWTPNVSSLWFWLFIYFVLYISLSVRRFAVLPREYSLPDSRDQMRAPADTINNRMTPERISKGNALEDYRDFKSAVDPKTCSGVKPPDLLLTLAQTLTLNPV